MNPKDFSAFPIPAYNRPNGELEWPVDGISARDYFASSALHGRLASGRYEEIGNNSFTDITIKSLAELSYKIADAMIEARNK